jgi:mono/diheme cytochrome c family protein
MNARSLTTLVTLLAVALPSALRAGEPTAAERGERALLTRTFNPPTISLQAYRNVWRVWGDGSKEPPADYARAFADRYGLPRAPYANEGYPMGLREANGLFGKGLATDCLTCHGGSIAGQSYVGLGNASLDYQALVEDLAAAEGRSVKLPFTLSRARGTTEAAAMSVYLLSLREPDLSIPGSRLDLDLHDDLCEDTPAWWLLKKKKTMYLTGGGDARSVRSLMQFMLTPLNPPSAFAREEPTFADIQAYILSLQPPRYPFPIDHELAGRGEQVFNDTCARCHGTYGRHWTYPNRIVPLAEIGTDPARSRGISEKAVAYYNASWFARERTGWLADEFAGRLTAGYQAPPLDGIWATAPYLHNGSVPTVYGVLNSKTRPKVFTRSYRTGKEDYDPLDLGWKFTSLDKGPDPRLPGIERRKVYDTTQPGRGNAGHAYGDKLSEDERKAVLEYLKRL